MALASQRSITACRPYRTKRINVRSTCPSLMQLTSYISPRYLQGLKCDSVNGQPCSNCQQARSTCHFAIPKRRGSKPTNLGKESKTLSHKILVVLVPQPVSTIKMVRSNLNLERICARRESCSSCQTTWLGTTT